MTNLSYDYNSLANQVVDDSGGFNTGRDEWTQMFHPDMVDRNGKGKWAFAPYDLVETAKEYSVVIDVPGVSDLAVHADDKNTRLHITGSKLEQLEPGERLVRSQRSYGNFHRKVLLPINVASEGWVQTIKDGVLLIRIPKAIPDFENFRKVIRIEVA